MRGAAMSMAPQLCTCDNEPPFMTTKPCPVHGTMGKIRHRDIDPKVAPQDREGHKPDHKTEVYGGPANCGNCGNPIIAGAPCHSCDPPAPVDGGPFEIEYDERMGMSDWNWSVTLFGRRVGQMYDTEDQAIAERDELNAKLAAGQSSHQLGEQRVREAAEAVIERVEVAFGDTPMPHDGQELRKTIEALAALLGSEGEDA